MIPKLIEETERQWRMSGREMARYLDLNYMTLWQWKQGNTRPSIEALFRLKARFTDLDDRRTMFVMRLEKALEAEVL